MKSNYARHQLVRIARIIPPLRYLHDQRNTLLERVAWLEYAHRNNATLSEELGTLRDQVAYTETRRAQGHIVEFDYPYQPQVRSWDGAADSFWKRLISSRTDAYRQLLSSFLAYGASMATIATNEPIDEREPYWSNPWFPPLDAICLTGLLAHLNPRRFVEVGSGISTKFARRAITAHNLRTKILSIDPAPRAVVDELCDVVIRKPLENCDLSIFNDLCSEDVLFMDNSHRSFQGSDVTIFFTEILPRLNSGCLYGIHDIFLPHDYPDAWRLRYYNEQYLLMAYLLGGARGDEVVLPVHYVQLITELFAILEPIVRRPVNQGILAVGGAFWLRRA